MVFILLPMRNESCLPPNLHCQIVSLDIDILTG
jgi:hypothetical protein